MKGLKLRVRERKNYFVIGKGDSGEVGSKKRM